MIFLQDDDQVKCNAHPVLPIYSTNIIVKHREYQSFWGHSGNERYCFYLVYLCVLWYTFHLNHILLLILWTSSNLFFWMMLKKIYSSLCKCLYVYGVEEIKLMIEAAYLFETTIFIWVTNVLLIFFLLLIAIIRKLIQYVPLLELCFQEWW